VSGRFVRKAATKRCVMDKFINHNDLIRSFVGLLFIFLFISCNKTIHDRRPKETDTPESREYFGCRVNGADFVSEARTGNVSGACRYTPTYDSVSVFHIVSNQLGPDCSTATIEIVLDSVQLKEGKSYFLGAPGKKKNYATYSIISGCSEPVSEYATTDDTFGVVRIRKFNPDLRVVSATFFFTVMNADGDGVQIADGYFDRHFTLE
jgi:hypothetical protein